MRESRISKLACGWVATILNRGKRQSEVGCHDTISTSTAAHPEQNMYSPFCCRIFREAFNNSSMPTTAGFTGNPYHDILRFSCQLPARIYNRRVDHIKRIDLFAHNFMKIRWPAIFSQAIFP